MLFESKSSKTGSASFRCKEKIKRSHSAALPLCYYTKLYGHCGTDLCRIFYANRSSSRQSYPEEGSANFHGT